MKILMISTDRLIFSKDSEVRARMIDYASLFDELRIIVFAKKSQNLNNFSLTGNCQVFSTDSLNQLSYVWDAIRIGNKLIKDGENWIITSQDPFETGLVAWWLKREKGIKWQAQIHTDFMSPFFSRESWLNWLRVKIARRLLLRADKIRVVSERIKKSIMTWPLKSEPVVLPIFVPPLANKICSPSINLRQKYSRFSFIILMASRLTTEKNLPLALGAFAEAMRHRPYLGLVIVGQGPEKSKLQQLAKTLNTDHQIVFEDWSSDLDCYYRSADLFMLSSNYEGYGRTLVEAGLNSCPILTTDIGIVGEIITDKNALICPVGDEDCLAQKIGWAIANRGQLPVRGIQLKNDLNQVAGDKNNYLDSYYQAIVN